MFTKLALPVLALASMAMAAPAPVVENFKRNDVYPTARRPASESMTDFQAAFTTECNNWAPFHQPGFYYEVEINSFSPGGKKGGEDPEDLARVACYYGSRNEDHIDITSDVVQAVGATIEYQ